MPAEHDEPGVPISVDVRVEPSAARVVVAGEVDMNTADRLRESLLNALGRRPAALTVDLDGVTFLDSTGIAVLVQGYRLASEFGIPMGIVNCHPPVLRALEVSGVLPLLSDDE